MSQDSDITGEVFGFFTEIGIINQLSTAMLAKSLPDGVHPSHFSILNHLARLGDGKPPLRIASAMQVTKNTMTHSLKKLEDRGYIDVQPDPDDGRGKLVFLTAKGRRFREEAITSVSAHIMRIIGEDQLTIMRGIRGGLEQIREHLDNNR
ncbi:MarR family winged helix-turn-helix transcriptional regulator [Jannaschia sp. CCS1]|uniref:MarR family winged helix-turn-helix transcriptional regulator n=1 Tax=Jannaschia sp. (strain CCS1) TaxID=290400 RepID=UPI000053D562|nr:MarR family transcriptional regulator [Jannaschia sp. CCS1]ABD55073.1 transcriptional regulator, MarR family [Jannaschia sp. CCS1]